MFLKQKIPKGRKRTRTSEMEVTPMIKKSKTGTKKKMRRNIEKQRVKKRDENAEREKNYELKMMKIWLTARGFLADQGEVLGLLVRGKQEKHSFKVTSHCPR